jgi:hypothetical protein|tara:strand:- start:1049 stop:1573 length:525 start_codon:yes stop_codon:yes gene_type:complete
LILIELEKWEYEWASHVGIRRFTENWEKQDAAHYKREYMEDDRSAQVAAAVGELAVARVTNQYWGGHVWAGNRHQENRNRADVGENIEVRRVRTSSNAAVRRRQLGKGLFLFVVRPVPDEFRTVEMLGWLDHDEAWELGKPSGYDEENTRVIAANHLHCVTTWKANDKEKRISD